MKKTRKVLSAVLTATIACSAVFGAISTLFAGVFRKQSADEIYYETLNESMEIYTDAVQVYTKNNASTTDGEKAYYDDYAGAYVDDRGILHVGYVGNLRAPSDFDGQVVYDKNEFSYNFLQGVYDKVVEVMLDYDVATVGVDEELNNVSVYVRSEEAIAPLTELLQVQNGVPERALRFIVEEGGAIKNSIAYGGESITRKTATGMGRGTICVNAIDNTTGQLGILTNEHVASSSTGAPLVSYRGHLNLNSNAFSTDVELGKGTKGQYEGTIDASFVPYANQKNWEVTPYGKYNQTEYSNVRLGKEEHIVQGARTLKIGQTTGVTEGEITHVNTTTSVNYGTQEKPNVQKISNVFYYSNKSLQGDSGGPVYYNDGVNLYLIGMNFAGPADASVSYGVGCRITNVMSILNVTPITNDSFTVSKVDGGVSLDKVTIRPTGVFNVPSELNGKPVVAIGNSAMKGSDKVTEIKLPNTVTEIGASAFSGCSALEQINLPTGVKAIGGYAFKGCSALKTFDIPEGITSIGDGTFAGCGSLQKIEISEDVTSIGVGAFAGCSSLYLQVNQRNLHYRAQSNILYDKNRTKVLGAGDVLSKITLPETVVEIENEVFNGNTNVRTVYAYSVQKIGRNAFANCENLEKVYCYSFDVPSLGEDAFAGSTFALYTPYNKQDAYETAFAEYTDEVKAIPTTVSYTVDGKTHVVDSYFGASVSSIGTPTREGYTFVNYTDENDKAYGTDDVWDNAEGMVLKANWKANEYFVSFAGYGAMGLATKTVVFDAKMGELPTPTSAGPVFIGWKDADGKAYTADTVWKTDSDVVLYADYNGVEEGDKVLYAVTFDKKGGDGGSETVTAEYSTSMPEATAPTREGYVFKGYYTGENGTGVKYYNADMTSATAWETAEDTTLYAHWEEVQESNPVAIILIIVGGVAIVGVAVFFIVKSTSKKRKTNE